MSYLDIINRKKKEWDCSSLMDGSKAARGDKIPFSSPLMNYISYGGIPRNKMTEFYGDLSSGKSTTAIDVCKNAIDVFRKDHDAKISELEKIAATGNKAAASELADLKFFGPRKVLYIDLEHSFDDAWCQTLGIKDEEIEIMQPPDVTAEDILQTVEELVETSEVGLIVLDSIPSLVPKSELEKKFGEKTVASLAGLLTIFCRKIIPKLSRYQVTLLVINQIRENMDNPYVVKTPGGKALPCYCSLRIQFRIGQPVDFLGNELPQSSEDPAGYIINAKITKQKSAPNDRKNGSYFLMCQDGIRPMFDFAKLAVSKYGMIRKGGAWFTLVDPDTGEILEEDGKPVKINGMAKVYQYLEDNPGYYRKIQDFILNDINGKSNQEESKDDELIDL